MALLDQVFGFTTNLVTSKELPSIFGLPVQDSEYISTDIVTIYSKILTDVAERCHGLKEEQFALLWDNCVKSSTSDGLITLIAKAMEQKSDLYLVYEKGVGVIRKATSEEQAKIVEDYKTKAKSSTGVYITFKQYRRTDMVKLYSGLAYCTISALNRTLNVSAAVQVKIDGLRKSVSATDSAVAIAQAEGVVNALMKQQAVLLDAKDIVETAAPDLTATEKSIAFIAEKLSFYLGLPTAYITGEQTGGIGSSGENDMRAIERGLKAYYFSIMKPTLESIFGEKIEYKSQDFRMIASSMEVLKTLDLISEEFISAENKTKLVNRLLGLPEEAEGDGKPEPVITPGPAAPKAIGREGVA